jgi:ATP-binding cassette, subfamily B, bacterial PglK
MWKTIRLLLTVIGSQNIFRLRFILLLMAFLAFMEAFGVASVLPFLTVLGDTTIIEKNEALYSLKSYFETNTFFHSYSFLNILGIFSFLIIVSSSIFKLFAIFMINKFVEYIRSDVSFRILKSYMSNSYEWYIQQNSMDLTRVVTSEVDQMATNILRPFLFLVSNGLIIIVILVLILLVEPIIALLTGGILGSLYFFISLIVRRKLFLWGKNLIVNNTSRYNISTELIRGFTVFKLFRNQNKFLRKFLSSSKAFSSTIAKHQTLNIAPRYIVESIAFGGIILITVFLMNIDNSENYSRLAYVLPTLGLYAFAAYRIQPAMQLVFQGISSLQYGDEILKTISNALELATTEINSKCEESEEEIVKFISLQFKDVDFSFFGSSNPILKGINFKFESNSIIGIIGQTGSGKSTLINLILGLYNPTHGEIIINGDLIAPNRYSSFQKFIGYVPQDIFLLDGDILNNVALGAKDNEIDLRLVENCCKKARIYDFIFKELPDGFDTNVGENGIRLSGGQRQRIGIARALYNDPQVIIFDEATSALDNETEELVMDSINDLKGHKTIIMVAHRLSTLKKCDKIFKLEKGVLKEVNKNIIIDSF